MSIRVTCDQCAANDRVADEHAGKAILCKACHAPMVVPSTGDLGEAGINTTANGGARRKRNWGDEEEKKAAIAKPKPRGNRTVAIEPTHSCLRPIGLLTQGLSSIYSNPLSLSSDRSTQCVRG